MTVTGFFPRVIESNDWQCALVPIYYKLYYMNRTDWAGIKQIFTIHNIEYQGKFPRESTEDLFGIPFKEYPSLEYGGGINLVKAAIDYSDAVTTVSPAYAREILSDYYAHGLAAVLNKNRGKLTGILNGIDYDFYNPAADKSLFYRFDATTSGEVRARNKLELQAMLDLPQDERIPMVAVISRLVAHKGMDLIKYALPELLAKDIQIVVLGKGEAEIEAYFTHMQSLHRNKLSAIIAYNSDISRKIYGSCDIFLMPSKSEPCGIAQMIASRYGAVPVVRETGGLSDSIRDAGDGTQGNGYTFAGYNAHEMLNALNRALGLYTAYPELFAALRLRVMTADFSWTSSAGEYIRLYESLM